VRIGWREYAEAKGEFNPSFLQRACGAWAVSKGFGPPLGSKEAASARYFLRLIIGELVTTDD
jgi:hypothetical protein